MQMNTHNDYTGCTKLTTQPATKPLLTDQSGLSVAALKLNGRLRPRVKLKAVWQASKRHCDRVNQSDTGECRLVTRTGRRTTKDYACRLIDTIGSRGGDADPHVRRGCDVSMMTPRNTCCVECLLAPTLSLLSLSLSLL